MASWTLFIEGMVDEPYALTYDELVAMSDVEEVVTLSCVSNEVGGDLVGNAVVAGRAAGDAARPGRRAGRRDADRRALGRRLHRRLPDGGRSRRPDRARGRGDERRAAAGRARLPGPARRRRPLRLRVGDQVARRHPADDVGGLRRLLDPAWLVQGGTDQDGVAHRRAAQRGDASTPAGRRSPACLGAAGRDHAVEVQVDDGDVARGPPRRRGQRQHMGAVARRVGRRRPASTRIRVRATDAAGTTQTEEPRRPAPDGATGWHTRNVRVR